MGVSTKQVYTGSIAASGTVNVDGNVAGGTTLVVAILMTDGAASADAGALDVKPYLPLELVSPKILLDPVALTPTRTHAKAFSSPNVTHAKVYDVRGLEGVKISFTNDAVAARATKIFIYLQ